MGCDMLWAVCVVLFRNTRMVGMKQPVVCSEMPRCFLSDYLLYLWWN